MFISGAKGALKRVLVRQNPNSLTEAIQIAIQLEQIWSKLKLAKQRIHELADMEDHELEQNQDLEPQIIRQVNQQQAKLGYQPFKTGPCQKFSAEQKTKVQPKEELKK
jgi:hypothetical protein